jgi:uncharacterized protein (DUF1330 family)
MKKGYWIVAYRSISDESATRAYGEVALPAVESFGGRFLTRSFSRVQPHEAGLPEKTVVLEFDSYERALAAYESEASQKGASGARIRRRTGFSHHRRRVARGPDRFSIPQHGPNRLHPPKLKIPAKLTISIIMAITGISFSANPRRVPPSPQKEISFGP